jgi:hypothetical protein
MLQLIHKPNEIMFDIALCHLKQLFSRISFFKTSNFLEFLLLFGADFANFSLKLFDFIFMATQLLATLVEFVKLAIKRRFSIREAVFGLCPFLTTFVLNLNGFILFL